MHEKNVLLSVYLRNEMIWFTCIYIKKLSDICSLWNIKFYDYESYNILREENYKEKFFFIRQDVSSLRQSYQLSDLSYNNYFVMRTYIWWLCRKWRKFNLKGFGNIILMRKMRTIIFLRRAYMLLL